MNMLGEENDVNMAFLTGRLGGDPQFKIIGQNKEIATFSLATSEYWKEKNTNEMRERTDWHRVVVYDENAISKVKQHLEKGSRVTVVETIHYHKHTDSQGVDKFYTDIVINPYKGKIEVLDGKKNADASSDDPIPF